MESPEHTCQPMVNVLGRSSKSTISIKSLNIHMIFVKIMRIFQDVLDVALFVMKSKSRDCSCMELEEFAD